MHLWKRTSLATLLVAIILLMSMTSRRTLSASSLLQRVLPTPVYQYLFQPRDTSRATTDLDFYWWSGDYLERSNRQMALWPEAPSSLLLTEVKDRQRIRQQLLLLSNPNELLPLRESKRVRLVALSESDYQLGCQTVRRFAHCQPVLWEGKTTLLNLTSTRDTLPVIILINGNNSPAWWHPLLALADRIPIVLLHFGDTNDLLPVDRRVGLLHCPENTALATEMGLQALFGAVEVNNSLTYDINPHFVRGSGLYLRRTRLQYALPEELGMNRTLLDSIAPTVEAAIAERGMPGCQILIAKEGRIVYERSFGHHTYQKQQAVHPNDLYDLASITKAAATTLAVMRLYEIGQIQLDHTVSDYLPEFRYRAAGSIPVRDLLAHHTGLQADLPVFNYMMHWKEVLDSRLSTQHSLPFGPERFLAAGLPDRIKADLCNLEQEPFDGYNYSDVNFVLLQTIIERLSGLPLDVFLEQTIYQPLGLRRLTFQPLEKVPEDYIVPTVRSSKWRGGLLRGYVHDEGAALLGGVGGHAGLFSNAADLAIIFQLLLNGGEYGGQRFFQPETVALFTAPSGLNYRALGFDRLFGGHPGFRSIGASTRTFGHLGFTGTAVWADPETDLIFIFLSNRVYPELKETDDPFIEQRVRQAVHWQAYRSLLPEA